MLEIAQCSRSGEHQCRALGLRADLVRRFGRGIPPALGRPPVCRGLVLLCLDRLAFPASSHFRKASPSVPARFVGRVAVTLPLERRYLACATARCRLGVHCTLPTWRALHAAYLACATARSAGGTAIRSGCAATCDLTISSACATAPASPARYTELASIRVFCDAGVESGLS